LLEKVGFEQTVITVQTQPFFYTLQGDVIKLRTVNAYGGCATAPTFGRLLSEYDSDLSGISGAAPEQPNLNCSYALN